ncbi:hypothetical protein [Maricaulis sp.]|uniref:hypothetical protein n=1 Tax=Maricaulis sp. TaxID=1486257 RepID=UPI0026162103|nr:hypothetical protein [Maricaulis sp.]
MARSSALRTTGLPVSASELAADADASFREVCKELSPYLSPDTVSEIMSFVAVIEHLMTLDSTEPSIVDDVDRWSVSALSVICRLEEIDQSSGANSRLRDILVDSYRRLSTFRERLAAETHFTDKILNERLDAYLSNSGVTPSVEARQKLLESFPELSHVAELRQQYRTNEPIDRAPVKYGGIRVDGEPEAFLKKHYAEAIEERRIWAGVLERIDNRLYYALVKRARRDEHPVADFFGFSRAEILERRRSVLRELADTNDEDISPFFYATKDRIQTGRGR